MYVQGSPSNLDLDCQDSWLYLYPESNKWSNDIIIFSVCVLAMAAELRIYSEKEMLNFVNYVLNVG